MKNKNNIIYGSIALTVFLVVIAMGTQVCLGFSKTYTEDATCQYLRTEQNISMAYTCTLGQEYDESGIAVVHVRFNLASSYFDQKSFTFNEITKEITKVNTTS